MRIGMLGSEVIHRGAHSNLNRCREVGTRRSQQLEWGF